MLELIKKKRNGFELGEADFSYIIDGFVKGDIPDYQISAFLMAVYFKGLNSKETALLTDAMMRSGELIDLSGIKGTKADKHSTGGVGDKTTLVLAPLVAAAGVPVAKMSGRGLGFTGGTLDKLESIKGLSVNMTKADFIEQIKTHGIAICGQSASLVPADKKLYALRDVTGTVDNVSLIASSIMSKKLACGADAIVIDIKVGNGAYMKTLEAAENLGKIIIEIGSKMKRKVVAVISAMDEPLGFAVGNALEVKEAIATLKGKGPEDLTALCLELGSHMLALAQIVSDKAEGKKQLQHLIQSGQALEKFKELIKAQGGNLELIENPDLLPSSTFSKTYKSNSSGYIQQLNASAVGLAAMALGAGRAIKETKIDYGAGIVLKKKCGDYVNQGEELAILYSNEPEKFAPAIELMDSAYHFSKKKPPEKVLILKTLS